jgi:glycosyltransferase involved in cell wall biosynthesis
MKQVFNRWIVCQIGAREHYAIARALHRAGILGALVTDFWVEPGSVWSRLPKGRRLKDRFHGELQDARVIGGNLGMLCFEARNRGKRRNAWEGTVERNGVFQRGAIGKISGMAGAMGSGVTLFSYSYAARELFRYAKSRGWTTVLGQIDPGPEEERIVAAEHVRYGELKSTWTPVPAGYWESWREEVALADRVIVNSAWSRDCLLKEGVPEGKMEVVPLVYGESAAAVRGERAAKGEVFRVLFLGQINLRKGVGRLLEAMRLLREEAVELTLAGPSEIDPVAWEDLPKVKWVGPVPRSGVGGVYACADVFILPTLSDGYALTQLEAMACGLRVIASRRCGAAVTDGVNGWLLEDEEPGTIAAAILRARDGVRGGEVELPRFGIGDLGRVLTGGGAGAG